MSDDAQLPEDCPMSRTAQAVKLLPYRCQSHKCREDMEAKRDYGRVMFLPEGAPCEVCQSRKYLYPLAIVHLIQNCPEGTEDALQGRSGMFKIVCGIDFKKGKHFSMERDKTDGNGFLISPIVTCPECRAASEKDEPSKRLEIEV